MKRVSVRTLVLLLELLMALAAYQCLAWAPAAQASAVWLDDEPLDPNAPDEAENPQPEVIGAPVAPVCLDDEPVDPNVPDEPQDPEPEAAGRDLQ